MRSYVLDIARQWPRLVFLDVKNRAGTEQLCHPAAFLAGLEKISSCYGFKELIFKPREREL